MALRASIAVLVVLSLLAGVARIAPAQTAPSAPATATASAPAGPKWPRPVFTFPEGAIAFHFGGGLAYPNFKTVRESSVYSDAEGLGFVVADGGSLDGKIANGGTSRQWPFGLVGNYLWTGPSLETPLTFRAAVPNGRYRLWLLGGRLMRPDIKHPRFLLTCNDTTVFDETCTPEQFNDEQHLFRLLWTEYSERPHALWEDYILKMFPMTTHDVTVANGRVDMQLQNVVIAAAVFVPAGKADEFARMAATLHDVSRDDFESQSEWPAQTKPVQAAGDGDYLLYRPAWGDTVMPNSAPPPDQRGPAALAGAGTPGQSVTLRLAVVPFADLGKSRLDLADLTGPGTIPAAAIDGRFKNWFCAAIRVKGGRRPVSREEYWRGDIREAVLLPSLTPTVEKGVTKEFWLTVRIPDDAAPGVYKGRFTFTPGQGAPTAVPVELEVYPFKLATTLPVSFGMYGVGADPPLAGDEIRRKCLKERLAQLRRWGMTACETPSPGVRRLAGDGTVELIWRDTDVLTLAKEVGLGRTPQQPLMVANAFLIGRYIGYRLVGKTNEAGGFVGREHLKVDTQPGLELRQPEFEKYFLNAARQYREHLESFGLPVVLNVVDEPREKGVNPWNRNYDDCIRYLELFRKVGGLTLAMNPMRDIDHYVNKDYTPFIDHVDVMSTHAWPYSAKLMKQTLEKGKTLWIYNVGKDRFSWGFYNWRCKTAGRWEWHLCFPGEEAWEYLQVLDWYSPFSDLNGLAPLAPYSKYPGAMLYQSAMLEIAEGITDYTYLYTLAQAVEARRDDPAKAPAVREAQAFLDSLDQKVPEFPTFKGLTGGSGAQVGEGALDEARHAAPAWRAQIAGLLKALQ